MGSLEGLFGSGKEQNRATSLFQARDAKTRERLPYETALFQQRMRRSYQQDLQTLSLYDFTGNEVLQGELQRAEEVAKSYLREKRSGFDLPVDGISRLHPQYVNYVDGPPVYLAGGIGMG